METQNRLKITQDLTLNGNINHTQCSRLETSWIT